MNWSIALGVAAVVGVLGSIAAVLWWRLANKAAPYSDEKAKPSARRMGPEEIVIRDEGKNA